MRIEIELPEELHACLEQASSDLKLPILYVAQVGVMLAGMRPGEPLKADGGTLAVWARIRSLDLSPIRMDA